MAGRPEPAGQPALGEAATRSPGPGGVYQIHLVKGWNQVTCPALEKLPWPVSLWTPWPTTNPG